jgi:hypothetical protein
MSARDEQMIGFNRLLNNARRNFPKGCPPCKSAPKHAPQGQADHRLIVPIGIETPRRSILELEKSFCAGQPIRLSRAWGGRYSTG